MRKFNAELEMMWIVFADEFAADLFRRGLARIRLAILHIQLFYSPFHYFYN